MTRHRTEERDGLQGRVAATDLRQRRSARHPPGRFRRPRFGRMRFPNADQHFLPFAAQFEELDWRGRRRQALLRPVNCQPPVITNSLETNWPLNRAVNESRSYRRTIRSKPNAAALSREVPSIVYLYTCRWGTSPSTTTTQKKKVFTHILRGGKSAFVIHLTLQRVAPYTLFWGPSFLSL